MPELEKPRVTEIQVRMDCNGCVQKIKKALSGINGIYDLYPDFPQQKIIIIGWADPEIIVKAIKKTRKTATICSHTEQAEPAAPQTELRPEGGAPPQEAANSPAGESPPDKPPEPPKDPPPENPPPEPTLPPAASDPAATLPPAKPSVPKDVGEVHVIYHAPPIYGYRHDYGQNYGRYWNSYHNGQGFSEGPPPPAPAQQAYVMHSYNTYRPSPYVTEYDFVQPQMPPMQTHYTRMERYSNDYHSSSSGNETITSMFSDENPNACRIV